MVKKLVLLMAIVVSVAFSSNVAQAAQPASPLAATYTAGIYKSCGNGAWVGLSARGLVTVRFVLLGGVSYSTTVDFGMGQSRYVRIYRGGSYAYAQVSGNITPGVRAGCN